MDSPKSRYSRHLTLRCPFYKNCLIWALLCQLQFDGVFSNLNR